MSMTVEDVLGANESSKKQADRKPRMPKFGVALFDNASEQAGGWASLAGGQEFMFRHHHDLPSDCIWVTSAEGNDFYPLKKYHHLRPADFFRSRLKYIAQDFGFGIDGEDARSACKALSEVINRAALIAAQVYGWDDPVQYFRSDSLVGDIQTRLIKPNKLNPSMLGPLFSAYQSYSSPENGGQSVFIGDSIFITLRLNRLAHAKNLLSTPVPDGGWVYSGNEESTSFDYPIEKALDPKVPCLVEATVEMRQTDPEIAALLAFGSVPTSKRQGPRTLRSWISQPELQWLSQYARIKISRLYFTANSTPLPESIQLPEMLTIDPLWELSMSAGLVAESHWGAIVNPVFSPSVPTKKAVSVWGVWLRAMDRALCFKVALRLHKAGFLVKGYGNGSVGISVQRSRLPELLDVAMEIGFAHPSFREVFERNGMAS